MRQTASRLLVLSVRSANAKYVTGVCVLVVSAWQKARKALRGVRVQGLVHLMHSAVRAFSGLTDGSVHCTPITACGHSVSSHAGGIRVPTCVVTPSLAMRDEYEYRRVWSLRL